MPSAAETPCQLRVVTPTLEIECFRWGNENARPILMLHGWPDCALTWRPLAESLAADEWCVYAPSLRGFGSTRFLDPQRQRSGQLSALARDAFELIEALNIQASLPVIGHDWGARAAYILSCLWPERVRACIAFSVGWGTNQPDQPLSIAQASSYWYHWFMHTARGRDAVHLNRRELTRFLWSQWSPGWRFSEAEFEGAAAFFENPDWADVVIHSYTHRWAGAQGDPTYDFLEARLVNPPLIEVPTLMVHGDDDRVTAPSSSENRESLFANTYRRVLLPGSGHFPQREFPVQVASLVRQFLADHC
jgi:pimeloyl-ACP methyl ester carboxylesterase